MFIIMFTFQESLSIKINFYIKSNIWSKVCNDQVRQGKYLSFLKSKMWTFVAAYDFISSTIQMNRIYLIVHHLVNVEPNM